MATRLPRRTQKEIDGIYMDQLVRRLEDEIDRLEARVAKLEEK